MERLKQKEILLKIEASGYVVLFISDHQHYFTMEYRGLLNFILYQIVELEHVWYY